MVCEWEGSQTGFESLGRGNPRVAQRGRHNLSPLTPPTAAFSPAITLQRYTHEMVERDLRMAPISEARSSHSLHAW